MKILVFLLGIVLLCGCIGDKGTELMTSYTKANNRDMALDFVKHYESYKTEGKRLECSEPLQQHGKDIWVVKCSFTTTVDDLKHVVDMTIADGVVKTAVLDGNIQMVVESNVQ